MIRLLHAGERVPPVRLVDDRGSRTTIPQPDGRTMLWWEPQKMTKACASCATAPALFDQLRQWGVETFGVTLRSPSENAEVSVFAYEDQLRILSADEEVAEMFGVLRPRGTEWRHVAHRAAFLIEANGTIVKSWMIHHPRPFIDDVFRSLQFEMVRSEAAPMAMSPTKPKLFGLIKR